jgi:hypothetical protein
MKFVLPAVLCCFLLIGAMAMPKRSIRKLDSSYQCGYQVQDVYRWYNSQSGNSLQYDHFYCLASSGESAPQLGYTYEEVGFETLVNQQEDAVPLYRLYSATGGHFYTTSAKEKNSVIQNLGFTLEGNIGYIFSSQVTGSLPLSRYYHSKFNKHFYTIHPENESLSGWTSEGVIGYAFDPNGSADC